MGTVHSSIFPNLFLACQDPFDIQGLIGAAKLHPLLKHLLESSAQVWEGYTVEEHSIMVLLMFETFWARHYSAADKTFWRLFLLLHDIGKQVAVEKYGTKDRQHETTWPVMMEVLIAAQLDAVQLRRAQGLLDQDTLGNYFKDKITLEQAVQEVKTVAKIIECPMVETLEMIKVFFCCDAGGYTKFAGGCYSLDYLFDVDLPNKKIEFANSLAALKDKPEYRVLTPYGKYQLLLASVTASMAGNERYAK